MMAPYRPPGRSNRSGRNQADNDVFEGLPVKQWGHQLSRVSLAPPASEPQQGREDRWGEPPMPRDFELLNPFTQHLLRLARSGKVGTKRKQESDALDEERPEDETADDANDANGLDQCAYVAKKWKPVPEQEQIPEHRHFEFLAKRRIGLPNLYNPDHQENAVVPMRRTKVLRADNSGETCIYEALVPEGQSLEGEIPMSTELSDVKIVIATPGTIVEGIGIANEDGVLVAEHLRQAAAPRRNRPPLRRKTGPGRGKKRVTFTNPDGSTYTTIVPNATKLVPQPGQIVKHVSKGEEVRANVSAEHAAADSHHVPTDSIDHVEGYGSDEGEDEGEDEEREEGELSEDETPDAGAPEPAKANTPLKTSTHNEDTPSLPLETAVPAPMPLPKLSDGDKTSENVELRKEAEDMEQLKFTQNIESTEAAEPMEDLKPSESVTSERDVSSGDGKPALDDEPMEDVKPTDIMVPTDVVEPANATEPLDVVNPVRVVEPMDVTEPLDVTKPLDVAEPTSVVEPLDVMEPACVVEPAHVVEPVHAMEPLDVVEPVSVIEPTVEPSHDVKTEEVVKLKQTSVLGKPEESGKSDEVILKAAEQTLSQPDVDKVAGNSTTEPATTSGSDLKEESGSPSILPDKNDNQRTNVVSENSSPPKEGQ